MIMAMAQIKIPADVKKMKSVEKLTPYLRLNAPELISDWNGAARYFTTQNSKFSAMKEYAALQRINKVNAYMEKNRPRNGSKLIAYKVYGEQFPEFHITEHRFNTLYAISTLISLDSHELTLDQDALNAVSILRGIGERTEHIYEYISAIESSPLSTALFMRHMADYPNSDQRERSKAISKAESILRGTTKREDAICAVSLNDNANDVTLENSAVYYNFITTLPRIKDKVGISVLVIAPSPFFVRKWIQDSDLIRIKVLFAVENNDISNFFTHRFGNNKDFSFLPLGGLPDYLKKNGAPTHILMFGNHEGIDAGCVSCLSQSLQSGEHSLSLLCPDERVNTLGEVANLLQNNGCIESVYLYPSGINNETLPRRKILLHAKCGGMSATQNAKIYNYTLETTGNTQSIRRRPFVATYSSGSQNLPQHIRRIYRQQQLLEYKKNPEATRKMAGEFQFSNEITVFYSASNAKGKEKKPPRVEAYIRYPQCCQDATLRGKIIESSKSRTRIVNMENIDIWLAMNYLYFPRRRGSCKDKSVREIVGEIYRNAYEGQPITLKTYVFIHPELVDRVKETGIAKLNAIAQSELGEARLDRLLHDTVIFVLLQLFPPDEDEATYRQAVFALAELYKDAISHQNCSENPLAPEMALLQRQASQTRNIRRNLMKKSFTLYEARQVYQALTEQIADGNTAALGVMIRLLTGLESNIVSALQWRDFSIMAGLPAANPVYQLSVRRQLTNDGTEYRSFTKVIAYRVIPCPQKLTELLLAEKKKQMAQMNIQEASELDSVPIIQVGTPPKNVSPRDLSKAGTKIVATFHLPDELIQIPDDISGTVESNLNSYSGDIFAANHRHYCMSLCGLDEGEYAYWNGSQAPSTFARNYCDYSNPAAQLILLRKMERWASVLTDPATQQTACNRIDLIDAKRHCYTAEGYPTSRTDVDITITAEKPCNVSLYVDAEYGFDASISPVKEVVIV